jgi:hydrogenase maturation protein HypF
LLVADQHPEYLSSKLARENADSGDQPLVEIQHHHAHVASCMAENGVALGAKPILGVALDGLGFGDDGSIWGGEFLLAGYRGYERLGTFKPIAMIGGAQAIREPWRNTYAHLSAAMGWERFSEQFGSSDLCRYLAEKPLPTIDRMIERGINAPLATSCGRLFDAVAAALGFCPGRALFEGQGAMELEAAAEEWLASPEAERQPYSFSIGQAMESNLPCIDPAPMWQALLDDLSGSVPAGLMAARFHGGLALAITEMVQHIRRTNQAAAGVTAIALTGGCFQNKILLEEVARLLEADGLTCLMHAKVPANDGGLALGQAAIAAARHITN